MSWAIRSQKMAQPPPDDEQQQEQEKDTGGGNQSPSPPDSPQRQTTPELSHVDSPLDDTEQTNASQVRTSI